MDSKQYPNRKYPDTVFHKLFFIREMNHGIPKPLSFQTVIWKRRRKILWNWW